MPYRIGHSGVHHPLRGDEGEDASLTDGVQPFGEEIVVQAVQRKTPGRAVVEGGIENTYVAEGDVAAHHIEIAVAVRGQLLEALDIDLRFGMEPGKDAAGKQILFIGNNFGSVAGCGVALRSEGRDKIAGSR